MTTEHTPPPWRFDLYNNSIYGSDIRVARDITVEADGSLIVAAPDLLAALEQCLATMAVVSPEGAIAVLGAHDAIAKARGSV